MQDTPYFGRIDFREDGEPSTEHIYIGIGSFLDEESDQFLVYDWRAPVSSLYYDYGTGLAQFETPGGTVSGEIELKRQFRIRNGRIRNLFDTGVTIGDELLQAVLSRHSDAQMKSIVATIQQRTKSHHPQRTQPPADRARRAGSGKTSAALQRVAYLLYREPGDAVRPSRSCSFRRMGCSTATSPPYCRSLAKKTSDRRVAGLFRTSDSGSTFALEDPFVQMEYTLTAMNEPGYAARLESIRYKASLAFMEVIECYAAYLGQGEILFTDVLFRDEVCLSAEEIRAQFDALPSTLPIPNRMKLLTESLLKQVDEMAVSERTKSWVEEEIELLGEEVYFRVHQQLKRQSRHKDDSFDYHDREREMLAERVVNQHFKPLRQHVKRLRFLDMTTMYRHLFANPTLATRFASGELPEQWTEICAQTIERIDRGELANEDATPFLDLKERIEGFDTNTKVRHLFVDEAQDYSPFQMAFLKRLFPFARMTVLGDANQAIFAHTDSGKNGFAALASLFDEEETQTIVLTRSYRSTRPIIELTSRSQFRWRGDRTVQPRGSPPYDDASARC